MMLLHMTTYTISWQSNASQCYATSTTGSWLGELETSGSREFVAKEKGLQIMEFSAEPVLIL